MAKLSISGFDDLQADMEALLKMPDSISDDILNAQADIIVDAQKESMAKMLKGPYSTGETARSIKKGKVKKRSGKKSLEVAPKGRNRKGEQNAAVAFVNEYGKRGQPGRPAIRTANEQSGEKITAAGEKAVDKYLREHKL